jgi:hypothetical protein
MAPLAPHEIAGLALATPGVIEVIIRTGHLVYQTVNDFRTVDEVMAK